MFNHKYEELSPTEINLSFKPVLAEEVVSFHLRGAKSGDIPTKFYTATTPMRDFIANITTINKDKCSVKGVYNGMMQELKKVKLCVSGAKVGDRVMVTEHIAIDGNFELLATKKRILQGDLNFINCGWKSGGKLKYYRFDIYTGQSIYIVTGE